MCIVTCLKVEIDDGVELTFVIGKCWFAPMKQQTIPQLEPRATLICEDEAVNHIRSRCSDLDSGTLDKIYDSSPMATLCT